MLSSRNLQVGSNVFISLPTAHENDDLDHLHVDPSWTHGPQGPMGLLFDGYSTTFTSSGELTDMTGIQLIGKLGRGGGL